MTDSDRKDFAICVTTMAETLGQSTSELAIEGLFHTLRDCRLESLQAASLSWTKDNEWLPKPVQWRELAQRVEMEQLRKALPPARERAWVYFDPDCSDTGWREHVCRAGERCGRQWCDRHPPEWTHTYVTACSCRPTNPDYRQKHLVPMAHVESASEGDSVAGTAKVRRHGFSRVGR